MNKENGSNFNFNKSVENEPDDFDVEAQLTKILAGGWDEKLATESYEESAEALSEVKALRGWRNKSRSSSFSSFYRLFEAAGGIDLAGLNPEETHALKQALSDRMILRAQGLSPRVADIYKAILAQVDGTKYSPQFEETTQKIKELRDSGDLSLLLSGSVPYAVKANRVATRLQGELQGRRALDRRDRKNQEQESTEQPTTPPPAQDESKPGMDEMEKNKEGETAAIWTISPAYGGYFKEQSFDTWDSLQNKWRQSKYEYLEVNSRRAPDLGEADKIHRITANLPANQWTRLPLPYNQWLMTENMPSQVRVDQNGDHIVYLSNGGPAIFEISEGAPRQSKVQPETLLQFNPQFQAETLTRLQEIAKTKKGNLAKARAAAGWAMRHLNYSNDSSFNQVYDSDPNGYIAAIDKHQQADCDVAGTYFAALCASLNIPVRHCVGHMVKGKDAGGNSHITSGTGHAWSEIWDETESVWLRMDATPPGDPDMELELDLPKGETGEKIPGDYGEREAVGPTDEYLAELEKKLAELTEQLSYTSDERQLAQATGVELKEARQIVHEIAEAEDTRLPGGQRVVDLLSQLFSLIIEARRTASPDYTGPLRKREGGEEIEDIVTHKIGIEAHETDPRSRQKPYEKEQIEQIFGGFDLYMIGDKSGSMSETVDGEAKWQIQRRAEYLIFSALNRFERNLEKSNTRSRQPLSVRSQGISFRGSDEIDEDKPLSHELSPVDKVKLWHSLGNQGIGNGDVAALLHIYQQIQAEHEEIEHQGKADDRLRIVIACSDGYPDNAAGVRDLAGRLGQLNAVIVGLGLTETASAIPTIFNTPHSRGEVVQDINHLPAVVARHVILEATKLFPEKSKKSVEQMIASILAKFQAIN
ncbi:MAG: transglutaminase domain-containing protein [Bacillota bacterium]